MLTEFLLGSNKRWCWRFNCSGLLVFDCKSQVKTRTCYVLSDLLTFLIYFNTGSIHFIHL